MLEAALISSDTKINLAKASAVIVDGSQQSLEVMVQLFHGFGMGTIVPADSLETADRHLKVKKADLVVIDPTISGGLGFELIHSLRHGAGPNKETPIFLVMGHVRRADVARCRDSGANYVLTKPVSASRMMERLLWVRRDNRIFIECPNYCGPDRRFRFEGPPPGMEGRRSTDLKAALGDPGEPNLSDAEVASLLKPQRVALDL